MLETLVKISNSLRTENFETETISRKLEIGSSETARIPSKDEDTVRSLHRCKELGRNVLTCLTTVTYRFFEAIGVAQLIGVGSSQAVVSGSYFATYPTSPTPT